VFTRPAWTTANAWPGTVFSASRSLSSQLFEAALVMNQLPSPLDSRPKLLLRRPGLLAGLAGMGEEPSRAAAELIGDSELLADAYDLAAAAHAGQTRKDDGSPYLTHPLRVAELLAAAGFGEEAEAAALLHDVVEDSDVGLSEIARRFGPRIAEIVAALTEDEALADYEERKAEHRDRVEAAGPVAVAVYSADKLANLRDMRGLYAEVGERAAERFTAPLDLRSRLWLEDAALAERALPGTELSAALRAEAEGFVRDRAAPAAAG
jgi:guanosine-3',5'-bis(diphosphate) 3'-pyrophosphohydrolase